MEAEIAQQNKIQASIRQETYEQARQQHPHRWAKPPRDWSQPQIVRVNHPRPQEAVPA
jgi:hypothetical protein